MPRMLAPRNDLLRRNSRGSGASLRGSPPSSFDRHPSLARSSLSSASSLRRQQSSRQNALEEYLKWEEPTSSQNAEWSHVPAGAGGNALLGLVRPAATPAGPASARLPPLRARDDLRQRYSLHRASLPRPPAQASPYAPAMSAAQGLGGARRHTFHRIEEDDHWGQFVETAEAAEDRARRGRALAARRQRCAASFQHLRGARVVAP